MHNILKALKFTVLLNGQCDFFPIVEAVYTGPQTILFKLEIPVAKNYRFFMGL